MRAPLSRSGHRDGAGRGFGSWTSADAVIRPQTSSKSAASSPISNIATSGSLRDVHNGGSRATPKTTGVDRGAGQPRKRSNVTRRPSTPPGPTRPFTSADVIVLSRHPWAAWSLRIPSSRSPDILPPIIFSRSSTTLYSYRSAMTPWSIKLSTTTSRSATTRKRRTSADTQPRTVVSDTGRADEDLVGTSYSPRAHEPLDGADKSTAPGRGKV